MFSLLRLFSGSKARSPGLRVALELRAIEPADHSTVLRIEIDSHPNAWTEETFQRWLAQPNVSGHVLAHDQEIVAFFLVATEREYLHLVNLAVTPAHRRRGVGAEALRIVEDIARARGLARIDLEVRESNLAAQLLYRKAGYRAVEILRGYYGQEDGYSMRRLLPNA